MSKFTYNRRRLGVSIVRPIFLVLVLFELITYSFLLYFDLVQLRSRVLYIPLITNGIFILVAALAVLGTLRYVKKILLLYFIWCLLHIIWIILCLLTSLHMIKLDHGLPATEEVLDSSNSPSEILSEIAQWFLSTPIPYAYSMGWQLSKPLGIEAHTLVLIVLVWQFVIITLSGIFALLVRRAYLAEQRSWDDLDNWAV
ncbi:hypothetical protein K7432_012575 [Basidiobolus ranarum]|uniref:Uncharacterized protein n=1 Tax=Basidiobolus ranarum TaxID=34480 RepID=A0ABR2VS68_9FUNG